MYLPFHRSNYNQNSPINRQINLVNNFNVDLSDNVSIECFDMYVNNIIIIKS